MHGAALRILLVTLNVLARRILAAGSFSLLQMFAIARATAALCASHPIPRPGAFTAWTYSASPAFSGPRWPGASPRDAISPTRTGETLTGSQVVPHRVRVAQRRMCSPRSRFVHRLALRGSRHWARAVFGKAMTSRMDSAPVIRVTMRSRPKARLLRGGAPYCSASSRKPNLSWASWRDLEGVGLFCCTSARVDAHRAAADLPAVEHHVVFFGDALLRRGGHPVRGRPWARVDASAT